MSVETIMNVNAGRIAPWINCGIDVREAPTSEKALELSGLAWGIKQQDVFSADGMKLDGYKVNLRDTDNRVLGIVGKNYVPISNAEAFSFTDALIDTGDVRYETAGSINGGKRIWLQAKLPDTEILDDAYERYLVFTTAHDGTGSVRCVTTMHRIICQNSLTLALAKAKRSWSMKHMGRLEDKLLEAQACLRLSSAYTDEFKRMAEIYANASISEDDLKSIIEEVFPIFPTMSTREAQNVKDLRDSFMVCVFAPDIAKFRGTAWNSIQAISDLTSHMSPQRMTKTFDENRWAKIVNGHPFVDALVESVNRRIGIGV